MTSWQSLQMKMEYKRTKAEANGLKKLQKRAKEGSLVVVKTDKSDRFSVMLMAEYERAGTVHTKNDVEVTL